MVLLGISILRNLAMYSTLLLGGHVRALVLGSTFRVFFFNELILLFLPIDHYTNMECESIFYFFWDLENDDVIIIGNLP